MIYRGKFTDANGGRWQVDITTKNGDGVKSLTLSSTPLIIKYSGDDDIFKPLKLSGATITILLKNHIFDLYSDGPQDVSVCIYKDDALFWQGYVTPNMYSQNLGEHLTEVEIECVDCLSTLEHIKYNPATKSVRTFADLISDAIGVSGMDCNDIIIDDSAFNLNTSVSDLNWIDEDGEQSTYKEVLEEVLKFAHLTMLQCGNNIHIINYDNLQSEAIELNTIYSGAKISLTETYNNYSVVGSAYIEDKLIPDALDKGNLGKRALENELSYTGTYTGFATGTKKQTWTHRVVYFTNINSNITLHQNAFNNTTYTGNHMPSQQQNYFACWQLKSWGYDSGAMNNDASKTPKSTDYEYYIGARVVDKGGTKRRAEKDFLVTINSGHGNATIYPEGGFLALSFDCLFARTNNTGTPYMYMPVYSDKLALSNKIGVKPYVYINLRIGKKYYNGSSWVTNANTHFKVELGENGAFKNFTWHSVNNTNVYSNNVDDLSGYIIKLPTSEALQGEVRLSICTPYNNSLEEQGYDHIFLRNIRLDIAYPHSLTEAFTESEKEYDNRYNATANGGSKEASDIDLKITTWDKSAYSKAAPYLGGKVLNLVGEQRQEYNILDSYLRQNKQPNICIDCEIKGLVAPYQHVINGSDKFVINGCSLDAYEGTTSLNLTQKR